jgi:hypothetical protein
VTIKNKFKARALLRRLICDRLCAALMKRNPNRNISNVPDKSILAHKTNLRTGYWRRWSFIMCDSYIEADEDERN